MNTGAARFGKTAILFVLKPGTDYEAFIRERRNAQRLFVNVLYGDGHVQRCPTAEAEELIAKAKATEKPSDK